MVDQSGVVMKVIFICLAVELLAASIAQAQDPQALLQKYNCTICHATEEAGAGPAFVDIAERYKGNPKAAANLRAVVKKGKHGSGPWHMPPPPEVTDADAEIMVRYILSLKP
jgi:cytochrome c